MLTDRELASLILLAGFVVLLLFGRATRLALKHVIQAFLVPKIVTPLVLYLLYTVVVVLVGWRLGAWRLDLLKDTVVVGFTVAIPLFFGVTSARSGATLRTKTVKAVLGVSAIVALYVNLASLSLLGELIIQTLVLIVSTLAVFARQQDGDAPRVATALEWLLGIIGVGMFIFTSTWLIENWSQLDLGIIGLTAAMSVWLPLALLPFLYVLAFYAAMELVYARLPFLDDRRQPPIRVRIAVLLGMRGSLHLAKNFVGNWLGEVAGQRTYREAAAAMGRFRRNVHCSQRTD